MNVNDFLQQLQRRIDYRDQIVYSRILPERPARFGLLSKPLPPELQNVLAMDGIENLYTHQASCLELARQNKNVLVVTGTASGKTLCYNLPVVERLLAEPGSRALYLFPTKALAQDQLATLQRWTSYDPSLKKRLIAATYDGDTPSGARTKIRTSANIILSNPDMLHQSILPYHAKWAGFFRNLRFIVIDELHTARGIFGSQIANVLRRLSRLVDFHGGHCRFICASATIGNPVELAQRLINQPVDLVDDDGSPRGKKYFVFWNPPFTDASRLVRRSANIEAKELFTHLLKSGSQSIVFTRARVIAELIYRYTRDDLVHAGSDDLAQKIRAYRGGYLAQDRREIEKLLFTGKLLGVCATSALELGIDVGSLDAALMVGFPGTISSAWQQAGRSGRRSSESLAVLIASNDPIDQYIMHHPEYFFNRQVERALIDPDNPHILANHLACAAFELPLTSDDARYFGPAFKTIMETVIENNEDLRKIADHYHWASPDLPASKVNLRTLTQDTIAIVDISAPQPRTIGSLDRLAALEQLYPTAVYLHDGQTWLVDELDLEARAAYVRPSAVDYYTRPVVAATSRMLEQDDLQTFPFGRLGLGSVEINWQTIACKRIKFYTQETVAIDPLDLPSQSLKTRGLWLIPSREIHEELIHAGHIPLSALAGLQNLLAWALPILATCDPSDIDVDLNQSSFDLPAIVLYDHYLNGLGFARRGYENFPDLLKIAHQILTDCTCETGCPSCVGVSQTRTSTPLQTTYTEAPTKQSTAHLLTLIQSRL
jgi:DEAD/DEAH box helicase domain-containing protein